MPVKEKTLLLLAALLLLLSLWKYSRPDQAEDLRSRVEAALLPDGRETVAAWGRALSGEGERIPVQGAAKRP